MAILGLGAKLTSSESSHGTSWMVWPSQLGRPSLLHVPSPPAGGELSSAWGAQGCTMHKNLKPLTVSFAILLAKLNEAGLALWKELPEDRGTDRHELTRGPLLKKIGYLLLINRITVTVIY